MLRILLVLSTAVVVIHQFPTNAEAQDLDLAGQLQIELPPEGNDQGANEADLRRTLERIESEHASGDAVAVALIRLASVLLYEAGHPNQNNSLNAPFA